MTRVSERGFTLIENMVALAIFAIGIMAIVFLLLNGIAISRTSHALTGAYVAMQDMVGMIRADPRDAMLYNGVDTAPGSAYSAPSGGTGPGANINSWASVLAQLPGYGSRGGGYGTITVASVNGTKLCPCSATVTVYWGRANRYQVITDVAY